MKTDWRANTTWYWWDVEKQTAHLTLHDVGEIYDKWQKKSALSLQLVSDPDLDSFSLKKFF